MKFFSYMLVICLLLMACSAQKVNRGNDKPFFFIQMSDPQFGFFNKDKDFKKEAVNFHKAISAANRLQPAFVIITGDLANRPGDSIQISAYKTIAKELDPKIPLYNVAGNHEMTNHPTSAIIEAFRREFGPDYYSFQYRDFMGIVLNSTILVDTSKVYKEVSEQEKWLRNELQKAKENKLNHIVIFQHHPWFLHQPDEKDEYWNIPFQTRAKYLKLFIDYGVRYLFAGHLHQNFIAKDGKVEMVTTGPVGRPLGKDPSGFRVVIVKRDTIEHHYYSLDSIPDHIKL